MSSLSQTYLRKILTSHCTKLMDMNIHLYPSLHQFSTHSTSSSPSFPLLDKKVLSTYKTQTKRVYRMLTDQFKTSSNLPLFAEKVVMNGNNDNDYTIFFLTSTAIPLKHRQQFPFFQHFPSEPFLFVILMKNGTIKHIDAISFREKK